MKPDAPPAVVQVGPWPPPHGGVQTHLVALRDYLDAQGVTNAVVNLTRHRGEDRQGVYFPRTAFETARLLRRLPHNILHLHVGGNLTLRLLGLCLYCCWLPGRRAVLTFHSGGYPSSSEGRTTHRATFRAFVMRQFDAVIAVNHEIREFFARCGVPDHRSWRIAPHAIGVPATPVALRDDLARFYSGHDPVLVSVGLLEPEYDLPLQIDTMGAVLGRHPNAGLVMIGSGSLEPELRGRIAAAPYASHILLAGDVPHAMTLEAMRRSRVVLRTTLYDGDSISVREALHLGTTVIATDNRMRPAGCRLIPARDSAALERAIEAVVVEMRMQEPGAGASDENLRQVLEVYQRLLAQKTDHSQVN